MKLTNLALLTPFIALAVAACGGTNDTDRGVSVDAPSGVVIAKLPGPQTAVDLRISFPARFYLRYQGPGYDTGAFQLASGDGLNPANFGRPTLGTAGDPLLLPCDFTDLGGQVDIVHPKGPHVWPMLDQSILVDGVAQVSHGKAGGAAPFAAVRSAMSMMIDQTTQTDGYGTVSSTSAFATWLFQPDTDVPSNLVTSLHLKLTEYRSKDGWNAQPDWNSNTNGYDPALLMPDVHPADNEVDVFFVKTCPR